MAFRAHRGASFRGGGPTQVAQKKQATRERLARGGAPLPPEPRVPTLAFPRTAPRPGDVLTAGGRPGTLEWRGPDRATDPLLRRIQELEDRVARLEQTGANASSPSSSASVMTAPADSASAAGSAASAAGSAAAE